MRKLEEWIDYLEESLPAGRREQLEMLLTHSHDDKMVLDNLSRLRRIVEYSDPIKSVEAELNSATFLRRMHVEIMGQITAMKQRTDGLQIQQTIPVAEENSLNPDRVDDFSQGICNNLETD